MFAAILAQEAAEDGIWSGNADLADVLFLIAAVVFAIAAFLGYQGTRTTADGTYGGRSFWATAVAVGLCLAMIAWLVL